MIAAQLDEPDDFEAWRAMARQMVRDRREPSEVRWSDRKSGVADLFAKATVNGNEAPTLYTCDEHPNLRVNRAFLDLARCVILHREPNRLDLLYRVLWRMQAHPRLLDDPADGDVQALYRLARHVRRDIHKMRAFVRFRAVSCDQGGEHYLAWYEPDHRIERANSKFFVDRFSSQRWSIMTPRLTLLWDGDNLHEGPAGERTQVPSEDATEELWLGYYRSIFNPARLKVKAMLKEMPRRFWRNLPEARQIPELIAHAQKRETAMLLNGATASADLPPPSMEAVRQGIATCRRCPIGCNGTRPVAGEGPHHAAFMIVGEQPGDSEEREGRPFIGPAGQLLDTHLERAGIDRGIAYVTNAVKHFKFTARGKRRLHQNPTAREIDHCRWWLDAERALLKPRYTLVLGASAGRAVLGRTPSVGRERGAAITLPDGGEAFVTVHPSYLLRLEGAARQRELKRFGDDLDRFRVALARSEGS